MKYFIASVCTLLLSLIFSSRTEARQFYPSKTDSAISDIIKINNTPGAAIALVSSDSVIWIKSFGVSDTESMNPVTENTLFGIGSISKTFLSLAAMKAQEQGLMDINTPIKELLPSLEFENRWAETDPVRFIHLLEHTSGFDDAHFDLEARANASTPLSEIVKDSKGALITRWKPGSFHAYNNLGAILATYILEEKINVPFEEFLRKSILIPLDMASTTFRPDTSSSSMMSRNYIGNDNEEIEYPDIAQWPAGGLVASISDMSNFVSLFLNRGIYGDSEILSESTISGMETPESSLKAKHGLTFGYGKGLMSRLEKGHIFKGHNGLYGGFLSDFGYSEELNIGYIILLNNRDGNDTIEEIKSELLSHIPTYSSANSDSFSEVPITNIEKLTGCYQPFTVEIKLFEFLMRLIDIQCMIVEDGKLVQQSIIGDLQSLIHMGDNVFRKSDETVFSSVFIENTAGDIQWIEGYAYEKIPSWWAYTQFFTALFSVLIILIAFVVLLIRIPIRLIRKKKENLRVLVLPFSAISSLFLMIISFFTLYETQQLYSPGAILFFVFGIAFLLLSYYGLFYMFTKSKENTEFGRFTKAFISLTLLSCCLVSTYLFYWDIIGLTLWSY